VINPQPQSIFAEFKPRYVVGDVLWVKETWNITGNDGIDGDDDYIPYTFIPEYDEWINIHYKADGISGIAWWRSPLFMPRWASRITLEVTDVRVERLQSISNKNCILEGFAMHGIGNGECYAGGCYNGDFEKACGVCDVPRQEFAKYWDKLNAKRGFGWVMNPYVFVISFKRVKPE
jgi:hypothetical protein